VTAAAAVVVLALAGPAPGAHAVSRRSARTAVIGGTPAEPGSYPSLAFVLNVRGALAEQCSGTVVAPNLVLTAAHCVEDLTSGVVAQPVSLTVITGALEWASPARQLSGVSRVIVNPRFLRHTDAGDAALLVLSTPTSAPAIALARGARGGGGGEPWLHAGTPGTIVGWGKTHYRQSVATRRLMQAATGLQSQSWCEHHALMFDPRSELCTIDPPEYRTGGCEGDSGGPLLAVEPALDEEIEVGITIRAADTCATRYPTVFTSVSSISGWVHRWISILKTPPIPPTSTTTTTTTTTTTAGSTATNTTTITETP
jgi:secreted trypsin-like serine protease